ncbi:MAG: hypothetical protein PHX18_08515 [Candidatus Gastranaerophilales bacterium]|nr:hypothetical protein [Candidatus Gastranaerophilales bacterium]
MENKNREALSAIEISFIVFMFFFGYVLIIKPMLADIRFTDLKRSCGSMYNKIDYASKNIAGNSNFVNRFNNEKEIINAYSQLLQIDLICDDAKEEGCWSSNWLWEGLKKPGLKTNEGEFIMAELISPGCSNDSNIIGTCAALYIDTNGGKPPNIIGQDILKVYIIKNGIAPAGIREDILNPQKKCDMIKRFNWGCTARYLGIK